jgi:thymidylate synthase (FAD)
MIQVTYKGNMGNDLTVVNAARVSFGKESEWDYEESDAYSFKQHMKAKDKKLIKYLAKHGHISPFGHCFASFHVKAPVFVARQLVKHKFLRWNEISRRYVDSEPEFYVPDTYRGRSADKKQGSAGTVTVSDNGFNEIAMTEYEFLLDVGVCPEQARMVLPQSMMTEWYWSGSLDAFADMCNLRCKSDTQYETQLVAWDIYFEMKDLFPVSWAALTEELDDER